MQLQNLEAMYFLLWVSDGIMECLADVWRAILNAHDIFILSFGLTKLNK